MKHYRSGVRIRLLVFGAFVMLLLIIAVLGEVICPFDPYEQDLTVAKEPPSAQHLLGTDRYGRDMMSRVIVGARVSIFSALGLVAAAAAIGTFAGVSCAWRGGWADQLVMRLADLFLAFPGLVFALAAAAVLGGGTLNAVLALALVTWPKYARLARTRTLSVKNEPFMRAAVMSGSGTMKIILKHILPNILGTVIVTAALDIGAMMMELAGLSFLGFGAQPPVAEWGSMLSDSRSLLTTCPWMPLAPGFAVFISVAIFNLFGDAVRDAIDPRMGSIPEGSAAHG